MQLRHIVITPFPTQRAAGIGTIARAVVGLLGIGPWRVVQLENSHVDSPKHVHTVRPSRDPPVRPSIPDLCRVPCSSGDATATKL